MKGYILLFNDWLNIKYFNYTGKNLKAHWEFLDLEKYAEVLLGENMSIIIQDNPEKRRIKWENTIHVIKI